MKKKSIFKRISVVIILAAVLLSLVPAGVFAGDNDPNFCNLVLFVNFSDSDTDVFNLNTNRDKLYAMYNGTAEPDVSFKNYIAEISRNRLRVNNYFPQDNGEEIFTLKLMHPASYYTDDYTLLAEVISGIKSGAYAVTLDTAANKLDNREAGVLDNLSVIFQYDASSRDDLMYPHKSVYGGSELLGGVVVRNYNIIDSANLISSTGEEYYSASKQGVIAHEFLHSVGLPDLYRYNDAGEPVGRWDIMAGVGYFLQYPLSYLRYTNGWIDLASISQAGSYSLNAVTSKTGNIAYKIATPLSDSEFFVIEYRAKNSAISGFECKIPSSGLLIYRVDTSVEGLTNSQGENYIYVLRPEATDPNAATETYEVDYGGGTLISFSSTERSAVDPDNGETFYGSNELDKSYTENTIYYSNGKNSGIKIENIAYSADKSQITFDVSFADYESLDLWDNLGDGLNLNAYGSATTAYENVSKEVYAAYSYEMQNGFSNAVALSVYRNNEWVKACADMENAQSPKVYAFNGNIYLSLIKNNSSFCLYRLSNGALSQVRSISLYPNYSGFFDDGNNLYWYYVDDSQHLIVEKAVGGEVLSSSVSASYLTDPKLIYSGGNIYLIYSDMFAQPDSSKYTRIARYDPQSKDFDVLKTLEMASNAHSVASAGGKVYFLSGANSTNPILATYENGVFTTSVVSQMHSYSNVKLSTLGEDTLIGYIDTSDNSAKVLSDTGAGFIPYGADVGDSADCFDICVGENTVYAATVNSSSGKIAVKYKQAAVNSHTVTYLLDGNAYDAGNLDGSFNYNESLTVAPKAVKEGYTVTDWVSVDVTPTDNSYTMPDKNVTFRASSTVNSHTVTYLLDGNAYDAGNLDGSFNYNESLTVAPKAVKVGYTVTDWVSVDVTPTDNSYTMPDKNVTFRATSVLQDNYNVALDIPGNLTTNEKICLDGVEFNATYDPSLGKLTADAGCGDYKCACVYFYNANGVAVGMRVYRLSYSNHAYVVTQLTQFENILSYHGFSVRVTGVSGIRFKSGIDITKKTALVSQEGLEGCHLVEYGTLVMINDNRTRLRLPFIVGGEKVSSGKAYWKEKSVVTDKVFETLDNRHRFTSVLVNLPPAQYKTDFAFRSYMKLTSGNEEFIVYGPIVSRSIYTVSNQVIQSGSFPRGSSADIFLRNIINSAQ